MRCPLIRWRGDKTSIAWWEWFFAPIVFPLVFLGLVLCVCSRLVVLPLRNFATTRNERDFARKMLEKGRYTPWGQTQRHLENGEGTLIVEQAHDEWLRAWWVSNDIVKEAPMTPPQESELDFLRLEEPPLFVSWCFEHYLHPDSGKASLTDRLPYWFPPGFVKAAFFRALFPKAQIVMTIRTE